MPTPYTPIPAPFYRFTAGECDDEPTFGSPFTAYSKNHIAGTFSFGALAGLPLTARAETAEAIERVFWADLSGPIDPNGFLFNGGLHKVEPVIAVDGVTLSAIKIGPVGGTLFTWTLGLAASVAAILRADTETAPYAG